MNYQSDSHLDEWAALVGEHVPDDAELFERRRHTWRIESEDSC